MNSATVSIRGSGVLVIEVTYRKTENGPTSGHSVKFTTSLNGEYYGDGWLDEVGRMHSYSANLSGLKGAIEISNPF